MKYSKEELLAMVNGFFNDNPMVGNTPTAEVRGLIAQYLADKLQKPVVLSVKEIWDILDNFSQPQSSIFTDKPYNEDLAEAIHAAMKKEQR